MEADQFLDGFSTTCATAIVTHLMEPAQLLDAISTSFFGLLGIWAAVVRRHWFLRLAVVGSLLLGALLIPVYEVVIEFGIEMTLIMLGVWWVRGRGDWRPRLSMETALLTMAVVAVGSAVAARLPDWSVAKWLFLLGVGCGTALVALLCLWVVFGKARLGYRLVGLVLGLVLFLVLMQVGGSIQYAVRLAGQTDWHTAFLLNYKPEYLRGWLASMIPTTLLGTTIILSMLLLGRASRWFEQKPQPNDEIDGEPVEASPPHESRADRLPRTALAARAALVATMLLIATPLVYIFYRLMTPMQPPVVELPEPNGYDDLVAAGLMVPRSAWQLRLNSNTTNAQLERELALVQPALDRIALGLTRECYANPASRTDQPSPEADETTADERDAIESAASALLIRSMYLTRTGTANQRIQTALDMVRFTHERFRGDGIGAYYFNTTPFWWAIGDIRTMLPQLDSEQCRSIAHRLTELDATRETWESMVRVERGRVEGRDWARHVRFVLDEISGKQPLQDKWEYVGHVVVAYRQLIIQTALRAFYVEHGAMPDSLDQLVPECLSAIPSDPFGPGALKYQRRADKVLIYSVGPDGDDDGGMPHTAAASGAIDQSEGDQVLIAPLKELGVVNAADGAEMAPE